MRELKNKDDSVEKDRATVFPIDDLLELPPSTLQEIANEGELFIICVSGYGNTAKLCLSHGIDETEAIERVISEGEDVDDIFDCIQVGPHSHYDLDDIRLYK